MEGGLGEDPIPASAPVVPTPYFMDGETETAQPELRESQDFPDANAGGTSDKCHPAGYGYPLFTCPSSPPDCEFCATGDSPQHQGSLACWSFPGNISQMLEGVLSVGIQQVSNECRFLQWEVRAR